MSKVYYLVSLLPEIEWDSDISFTTSGFIAENRSAFQPLEDTINDIIILNDLYNLASFLRTKLVDFITGAAKSKEAQEAEFREPCLKDKEAMLEFVESPEDFPDFVIDYLEKHKESGEKYKNIESLFIAYFEYLQKSTAASLRSYGAFELTLRTVVAALRMRKMGMKVDETLPGSDEIKKIIFANSTASDFGLKPDFPEIDYLLKLFQDNPLMLEKGIDKIRYDYLTQFSLETPFVEDTIYTYILRLMILERWQSLDRERGLEIISTIVTGEQGK